MCILYTLKKHWSKKIKKILNSNYNKMFFLFILSLFYKISKEENVK